MKNVTIIGDSLLKGLKSKGLSSEQHNVRIRYEGGAQTDDLQYYVKPALKRKPDMIVVHCATNDFTPGCNIKSYKELKNVAKLVKETLPECKLAFSSIIRRGDIDVEKKAEDLNLKLEKFCKSQDHFFINNENIDLSCLSGGKLHLNKKGNSIFANNLLDLLKKC